VKTVMVRVALKTTCTVNLDAFTQLWWPCH